MEEEFWRIVCGFRHAFVLLFVVNVVFLVLLAFSLPFVAPGTDTYYVSLLSLPIIGFTLLGSGFVIRRCE